MAKKPSPKQQGLPQAEQGTQTGELAGEPLTAPNKSTGSADSPGNSAPPAPSPKAYDLSKRAELIDLLQKEDEPTIRKEIGKHIPLILTKHKLDHYTTLVLFDNCDAISSYHSNQIYEAASTAQRTKDIFLILQSGGGSVEPAYLISKTCKRLAKDQFVVAVPRRAKSAATLLALGADEIHMGLMSELGPVDPQIDGYPALGLINSLNVIAEISCKYPESAELFARYLSRKLDLQNLGYFVRIPESAVQYAERLLANSAPKLPKGSTARSLAEHFVNHYKDHGFVIDFDEASQLLGTLVRDNTTEYHAANEIYRFLYDVEWLIGIIKNRDFWYVGESNYGGSTRPKKK